MSRWPSIKARQVFRALLRKGWSVQVQKGSSHIQLAHANHPEYTWAFRDSEEIGPVMLAKVCKKTGLKLED